MIDKDKFQRRLLAAKYPRRRDADPRSAPDHNPMVLEDCPACGGSGTRCEMMERQATLEPCADCDGSGTTYALVSRFSNTNPAIAVRLEADGWMTCAHCARRFSPADAHAWTGLRHVSCGQRLVIEP